MKKSLYLGALALLTLASCASEETVEAPKGNAIDFGKAFINNSTRAGENGVELTDLTGFKVYGYMTDFSGVVFNGIDVTGSSTTSWQYNPLAYWVADKNYAFAAIASKGNFSFAPAADETFPTAKADFGTITYTTDGTDDLLYASAFQVGKASGNLAVPFTFNHLLSRVKLTFTNGMQNTNGNIVISNVKINGVYNSGSLALGTANAAWSVVEDSKATRTPVMSNTENVAVNGTTYSTPLFFIPTPGYEYVIEFDVVMKYGETEAVSSHKTAKVTIADMQRGYSYNLALTLTEENIPDSELEPIEFTVTAVEDWQNWTDNNGMRF